MFIDAKPIGTLILRAIGFLIAAQKELAFVFIIISCNNYPVKRTELNLRTKFVYIYEFLLLRTRYSVRGKKRQYPLAPRTRCFCR